MKEKTTKLHSLESFQKEHQQEINNLQNQLQETENVLRRRFEERINNLQTEINEKVNTNHHKVKKEIDIARKAFPCFIFIFVVSVFSYQIYIVQPQQINKVREIFERKVKVLQNQIEEEVERKLHVIESQLKEEVKKVWQDCESKIAVVENQLETKLDEVQRSLPYGSHTFTWKTTGFEYIFSQARKGYQTVTRSDPFYIFGYKLKLVIYPNGGGDGAGTHISSFIFVMKGENDAILSWPFNKRVTVTLIDQQENPNDRENIAMSFTGYPEKKECFGRPVTDENLGLGYEKFVSHDKLRERRYIVDDTIFFQVQLATPLF